MPEGSSSDAPVIRPGPRALPRRFSGFFSARSSAAWGSTGRPGSTLGPTVRVDAFRSGKARFSSTLCKLADNGVRRLVSCRGSIAVGRDTRPVSYTHLRAHETRHDL